MWASPDGSIELRKRASGALALNARFPYGSLATLDAGGNGRRPRKEQFASRAFAYVVDGDGRDRDVHFLIGHSFDKPLASRSAGTLKLIDTDDALIADASIADELREASHVRDFLAMMAAGLVGGISPGFRVPPSDVVPNAETVEEEDPSLGKALIRTIAAAVLFELSAVTRPAYGETSVDVESRDWTPTDSLIRPDAGLRRSFQRWRA